MNLCDLCGVKYLMTPGIKIILMVNRDNLLYPLNLLFRDISCYFVGRKKSYPPGDNQKNMSRFSFEPVDNSKALKFWNDSPHASVFTHPDVLSKLCFTVEWWMACKGCEPYCLWPVCLGRDKTVEIPGPVYYAGPMWSRAGATIPVHSRLADSQSVYQGLASRLIDTYGVINAQLPVGVQDVRPFAWWNSHQKDRPGFNIMPRYTARLENLSRLEPQEILSGYRPVRRKEIRRLQRQGAPERSLDWDQEELATFFCRELEAQGLDLTGPGRDLVHSLTGLAAQGWGEIIAFRDPENRDLTSALVLLRAGGVSNMVLNITSRKWRSQGLNSWTIHQGILAAKACGDDVCDFNGANSPERGDDKHSYGAEARLYFELKYP